MSRNVDVGYLVINSQMAFSSTGSFLPLPSKHLLPLYSNILEFVSCLSPVI